MEAYEHKASEYENYDDSWADQWEEGQNEAENNTTE